MRRFARGLPVILLVSGIWLSPAAADGPGRDWHRGWRGPAAERSGQCVGCEFFGGLLLGGILGGLFASPHYPPAPVCTTQPGHWEHLPFSGPYQATTYQRIWVAPQTVCR